MQLAVKNQDRKIENRKKIPTWKEFYYDSKKKLLQRMKKNCAAFEENPLSEHSVSGQWETTLWWELCCVFEKSYYEEEKPPFKTNLILRPRTYYSQSKRKRKKRKIYELLSNNTNVQQYLSLTQKLQTIGKTYIFEKTKCRSWIKLENTTIYNVVWFT